jgi:acetoin utilization deacetylase AcuC-like enzyme
LARPRPAPHERGSGAGTGYTVNAPLSPGGDEQSYLDVCDHVFLPAVEAFKPELLMVSAGFDAHQDDPLSMMRLTERSFGRLAARVQGWADGLCDGRIVLVLEGGYNLNALANSVVKVIRVLDRESEL